jgi:anti-sigma-K factor RskA
VLDRTSTTERYTRSVIAAVVAVVALILAANAGPARATEGRPLVPNAVQTAGESPDRSR